MPPGGDVQNRLSDKEECFDAIPSRHNDRCMGHSGRPFHREPRACASDARSSCRYQYGAVRRRLQNAEERMHSECEDNRSRLQTELPSDFSPYCTQDLHEGLRNHVRLEHGHLSYRSENVSAGLRPGRAPDDDTIVRRELYRQLRHGSRRLRTGSRVASQDLHSRLPDGDRPSRLPARLCDRRRVGRSNLRH